MNINKKWIILGSVVLIAFIIIVIVSWPKKPIDNTQQIMNDTKAQIEEQYKKQIADTEQVVQKKLFDKDILIKGKEQIIKDYQSRLSTSEAKYQNLSLRYQTLQKEKENVKSPTSDKEMRDRFAIAGFPPAPIGICGPGYVCFSTGYSK